MYTKLQSQNLKGRDQSEDLGVDERLILKWEGKGKVVFVLF
jgi:hypothetical protein